MFNGIKSAEITALYSSQRDTCYKYLPGFILNIDSLHGLISDSSLITVNATMLFFSGCIDITMSTIMCLCNVAPISPPDSSKFYNAQPFIT